MGSDGFDTSEPELAAEDILTLDDPRFRSESVALVTGEYRVVWADRDAGGVLELLAVSRSAGDIDEEERFY